jgi:hypothetical protein
MLLSCSGIVELASAADAGAIAVELNKLETDSKSCRAYIVVGNPSEAAIQILKLELILFRPDAVIERRLAVDLGPVRPNKKSVKTFELEALPCETIGSILVNDVIDCRDATGPLTDCLARLTFSSRAPVQFSK